MKLKEIKTTIKRYVEYIKLAYDNIVCEFIYYVAYFQCKYCGGKCNKLTVLGYSKENTYIRAGCNKCKKYTYWSVDCLKHKPKLK